MRWGGLDRRARQQVHSGLVVARLNFFRGQFVSERGEEQKRLSYRAQARCQAEAYPQGTHVRRSVNLWYSDGPRSRSVANMRPCHSASDKVIRTWQHREYEEQRVQRTLCFTGHRPCPSERVTVIIPTPSQPRSRTREHMILPPSSSSFQRRLQRSSI